jgi:hypothetical protein
LPRDHVPFRFNKFVDMGRGLFPKRTSYYTDTVNIGADKSGLTIQNFNGEAATVSGGVALNLKPVTHIRFGDATFAFGDATFAWVTPPSLG